MYRNDIKKPRFISLFQLVKGKKKLFKIKIQLEEILSLPLPHLVPFF